MPKPVSGTKKASDSAENIPYRAVNITPERYSRQVGSRDVGAGARVRNPEIGEFSPSTEPKNPKTTIAYKTSKTRTEPGKAEAITEYERPKGRKYYDTKSREE